MALPDLTLHFTHQNIGRTLTVETGADNVEWGYGLNTQTMPTYGGEVIQILSAYIDDITITGTLKNYKKMEEIYQWFLEYIQTATQREKPGDPRFEESPVHMAYPERGWHLKFKPTSLPGFRLATDVTAPMWLVTGAVSAGSDELTRYTLQEAEKNGFDFTNIKPGVGYDEENPFTNFYAQGSKYKLEDVTGKLTDWYQNLIPSYLDKDFTDLFDKGFWGSRPLADDAGGQNQDGGQNQGQGNDDGPTPFSGPRTD